MKLMKIWLIAFIQLSQNSLMRLFFHFIYQMSSAHVSLILFIKKFCRLQHQVYTHSKYIVLQWYLCYYNSRGGTLSAMVYATKVKSVFCSMKSHTRWTTKMRETHQKIPQYSATYRTSPSYVLTTYQD